MNTQHIVKQCNNIFFQVVNEFPNCGELMLNELLKNKGIRVQRFQLRDSIHRVDKAGVKDRTRGRLKRRTYNVKGPNHLWHIDTNHKLIRWCFIVFGAIDGFSRLPVSLKCTTSNKADTILSLFLIIRGNARIVKNNFNCFEKRIQFFT